MDIYVVIVALLFLVAIADLIVGVSNDAVNFLNSAIGSKVAPLKTIMIVATVGILLGSFFSGGIMEVARKGIFNPEHFTFEIIMYLFLAVMLTDIILLDFFNTLGMPTSTTVSIVFELLGAASMSGLLLAMSRDESVNTLGRYINGDNARTIIFGIFLSVLIAFTLGAIAQFFARWMMSFDYERNLKRFGALFSGIAITAITYFLIIKGLKGSPFAKSALYDWLKHHTPHTVGGLFLFWTISTAIAQQLWRINPLKFVVLAGTFSLAMAFAGNDLVNFIGVPIAAYKSYGFWDAAGQPVGMSMEALSEKVPVDSWMLLLAGLVMALTLWFSPKAKRVTETEVNLGRQDEGDERFAPNMVARAIVRTGVFMSTILDSVLPQTIKDNISANFSPSGFKAEIHDKDQPAFDLVRASVNLMMASIIIAYATSKKLPLSTTYVSFMVAMGTSLADKAWGRESAVYRVAGVLSVIAGWFMTALIAFSVAAFFAFILIEFKVLGVVIVVALALYALVHSQMRYKKSEKDAKSLSDSLPEAGSAEELIENSRKITVNSIRSINNAYSLSLKALPRENVEMLRLADSEMANNIKKISKVRVRAIKSIKKLESENLNVGNLYILGADLIEDLTTSAKFLTGECLNYVANLHQTPDEDFAQIVQQISAEVSEFMDIISDRIDRLDFSDSDELVQQRRDIREKINTELGNQIEDIQINNMKTKQAYLQTEVLLQSRDIAAVSLRLYKLYRDFIREN